MFCICMMVSDVVHFLGLIQVCHCIYGYFTCFFLVFWFLVFCFVLFCFCLLLHLTQFSFYRDSLRNSPGSPGTYSVDQAGLEHLLGRNIFWVGPGAIEYHFGYILKNGIVGS